MKTWPLTIAVLTTLSGTLAPTAAAQDAGPASKYPRTKDVSTLDGIIEAYYDVVSGGVGEPRQVARDASLHHPSARVTRTGVDETGKPFARVLTLEEFHSQSDSLLVASGFHEREIHRLVEKFGNVTHVWSTYEWETETGGETGRGINSIQLYHDGTRYWITAWIFDGEREDNPIPPQFLP